MNKFLTAAALSAAAFSGTASAQSFIEDPHGYAGFGMGVSNARPNSSDYADQQPGATTSTNQNRKFGWTIFAGEQFNEHWGAEIGYAGLGQYQNSYSVPALGGTGNGTNKLSAWDFAATGRLPIGDMFALHAKLGLTIVKNVYSFAGSGPGTGYATSDGGTSRAVNPFVGLGGEINFNPNLALLVDYENFGKVGTPTNNLTAQGATGLANPSLITTSVKVTF